MTEFLGIHEELDRLVLRKRWIRWSLRNYKYGDYRLGRNGKRVGRHVILSERLTRWKPTFEQRSQGEVQECEF